MRFGTWNVKRLFKAGSLVTIKRTIKNRLDLVGVQARWDSDDTGPAGEHTFFYREGNKNHELCTVFLVHKRLISAVTKVEFSSDVLHTTKRSLVLYHYSECSYSNRG
jgi:hypothetical protein